MSYCTILVNLLMVFSLCATLDYVFFILSHIVKETQVLLLTHTFLFNINRQANG